MLDLNQNKACVKCGEENPDMLLPIELHDEIHQCFDVCIPYVSWFCSACLDQTMERIKAEEGAPGVEGL